MSAVELVEGRPNVEIRTGTDGRPTVVLAFPYDARVVDAVRRIRAAGHRLLRVPAAVFHHGKGGRSRRGILVREFWYAATDQTLACHRAPRRRDAARRMAGHRARSLADHVRERDLPGTAGIAAATALWPASALLAERRRRRPWDGPQLEAWLARHRPRAARSELGGAS